jgi:regulator of replication initiation timing
VSVAAVTSERLSPARRWCPCNTTKSLLVGISDKPSPLPELSPYGSQVAPERDPPSSAALTLAELGAAVRQIVAPLQEILDREVAQRQALQVEADELRDRLAAAQLATAMASGETNTERAKREAAEAKAKDLQGRLDKLQAETSKPSRRRRWWHF